ncbi:hypothetical protein SAMN02745136_05004, partial [Anaerocolumna jejuensis DSM 15929]
YAMGASVKEKRFHTPLFMAVPLTCLRYAMGARMKDKSFNLPDFVCVLKHTVRSQI